MPYQSQTMGKNRKQRHAQRNNFFALKATAGMVGMSVVSITAVAQEEIDANHNHGQSYPRIDIQESSLLERPSLNENQIVPAETLSEKGIRPHITYLGEVFNNHSGGIANGTAWAGVLDFGVELDLEKLVGWQGATFFINAFHFSGDDVSGDLVGDINVVSNLYTETSFNFYNIYLQQELGAGDSFFKVGQIALDDDFMVSKSSLLFLNASFGPLPVESGNTAAPIYSLAAPGAVLHYAPTERWFVQGGVYAGDAGPAVSNNQGFDWRAGGEAGWMFIAETGFKYGQENGSVAKLGGYYHSGEYTRFADRVSEDGISTFYGVIDHQISGARGYPRINVFLRGGITPEDDIATITGYADAGVVVSDIFMQDDALGLALSWTDLSDGGAAKGRSSEIVTELTYQIPVNDWFTVQPDIQYIINPQGGGNDAFLTGLRAELSF